MLLTDATWKPRRKSGATFVGDCTDERTTGSESGTGEAGRGVRQKTGGVLLVSTLSGRGVVTLAKRRTLARLP